MIIMLFWLMLIGSVISEITIALAWPTYRKAAANSLWINLAGSIVIALSWAIIAGVMGGGGGFTAMLIPVTLPIATVVTVPFYHIAAWFDNNKDTIPNMIRSARQTARGLWFILRVVFFPVRMLGASLIWLSHKA